jgi:type VI protein secretion system component VasA
MAVRYFCLLLASFFVKYIGLWTVNFIQQSIAERIKLIFVFDQHQRGVLRHRKDLEIYCTSLQIANFKDKIEIKQFPGEHFEH